ncbi:H-NS histone family protein [Burkholderia stagnalis]|uniref:H-NS histone family protein n=1 Tax=Burkholderia stagnalis TaxID=1503054 RepID=UPI00163AD054|nr:H-NS histone family protein [Burkholderia stagnalis]
MMESWKEYLDLKAKLEHQLELERCRLFESVVAEIVACVEVFGITEREIFKSERADTRKRRKAKYFDPTTGRTWSGVGREPLWIKGKDRSAFVLNEPESDR